MSVPEALSKTDRAPWIGVVDLKPKLGNSIFDGAPGAFSNVLCLARDEDEYQGMVEETFGELGFEVKAFEEIKPFEQRRRQLSPDDELLDLATQLSESSPLVYDTFYIYESEFE